MKRESVYDPEEFERCVVFHGHVCPGLALGYVAAKWAMEHLGEVRSEDEELVAVVENSSCFVDAVQVVTGCTLGKGNFFLKDHGKMALTLFSRKTGKGIRLCMKPDVFTPHDEHSRLLSVVMSGRANDQQQARFWELHRKKSESIVQSPPAEIFTLKPADGEIPKRAEIKPSTPCEHCGEPAMASMMNVVSGKRLCLACQEKVSK